MAINRICSEHSFFSYPPGLMRCCSSSGMDGDIDMPDPEANPWHKAWRDCDVCCFHSGSVDQCRCGIRYRFPRHELLHILFGNHVRSCLGCGIEGESNRVCIGSGLLQLSDGYCRIDVCENGISCIRRIIFDGVVELLDSLLLQISGVYQ